MNERGAAITAITALGSPQPQGPLEPTEAASGRLIQHRGQQPEPRGADPLVGIHDEDVVEEAVDCRGQPAGAGGVR